ncbi:hypothetical protein F4861DRAFT_73084 [Xylaria intraflava]|nr:hypothetical protein F4861DRAFT_73084 [Xylaria intraflava]
MCVLTMQPHRDNTRRDRVSWSGALRPTNRVPDRDATRTQNEREPVNLPPIRQALPEQFENGWPSTSSSVRQLDRAEPRRPITPSGYSHEMSVDSYETTPAYSYETPPSYSHETSPEHVHRTSGDLPKDLARTLSHGTLPDYPRPLSRDMIHGMLAGYPRRTSLELQVLPGYQQRTSLEPSREAYFPSYATQPDYPHRASQDSSHRSPPAYSPVSPRDYSPGSPRTYSPGSPQTYGLETPRDQSLEATSDLHRPDSHKRKHSPFKMDSSEGPSRESRSHAGPRRAWPPSQCPTSEFSADAPRRPRLGGERPWSYTMSPFRREQRRPSSLSHILSPTGSEQHERPGSLSHILSPASDDQYPRPGSLPHIMSPASSEPREQVHALVPPMPFPTSGDSNTAEPRHPNGDPHDAFCRDRHRRRYWDTLQGQLPGQIYANRYRPNPLEAARAADGMPILPGSFVPYYQRGFMRPSGYGMPPNGDSRHRRRRGNLPKETTEKLRAWFVDHLQHPYPTEDEKQELMRETNLQMNQISNWFINARRRHLPALISNAQAESAATNSRPQDEGKEGRASSSESEDEA